MLIFPEGERSIDDHLLPFRKGIRILACELAIPVVPVWIEGAYEVLPVDVDWRRSGRIFLWLGNSLTINKKMVGG